jgi:hypothetical protein
MATRVKNYRRKEMATWRKMKGVLNRAELMFWDYLFTGPHSHNCGLYEMPLGYALSDLRHYEYTEEEIQACLNKLCELGMCGYDYDTEVVYIPKMLEKQGGDSAPNVKINISSHLRDVPDCKLKEQFMIDKGYQEDSSKGNGFAHDMGNGVTLNNPNPNPNPKRETPDFSSSQKSETRGGSVVGPLPTPIGEIIQTPDPAVKMRDRGYPCHTELVELKRVWSEVSGQVNREPPEGDLKARMQQAVERYKFIGCEKAIRGFWWLSKQENSTYLQSITSAFPEGSKGGRKRSNILDFDRFASFIAKCPVSAKEKLKEEKPKTPDKPKHVPTEAGKRRLRELAGLPVLEK